MSKKLWIVIAVFLGLLALTPLALPIFLSVGAKSDSTVISERTLEIFRIDSSFSRESYTLEIIDRDSIFIYSYTNPENQNRNMVFRFDPVESQLHYGPSKIDLLNKGVYINDLSFDLYDEPGDIIHGIGPLLFNKTYGVLGWDNGAGDQYFFTDSTYTQLVPIELYGLNN